MITFVYIFLNIWLKITNNGSQKTLKRNCIHWGEEMRYKDDDKTWTHSGNNRALFQWAFNAKYQQSSSIWILGHLINRSSNVCSDELKSCRCTVITCQGVPSLRAWFGPNMFTECTTCSNRTRIQLQTMLSYKIM